MLEDKRVSRTTLGKNLVHTLFMGKYPDRISLPLTLSSHNLRRWESGTSKWPFCNRWNDCEPGGLVILTEGYLKGISLSPNKLQESKLDHKRILLQARTTWMSQKSKTHDVFLPKTCPLQMPSQSISLSPNKLQESKIDQKTNPTAS